MIVASGIVEQPLVFPGNDLVGVMLPDAARRLVNGFSIKPAERAVVLTVDDRGLAAAADLEAAGVEIAEIVDFRARAAPGSRRRARAARSRRSRSTATTSRPTSSSCPAARSRTTSCSPRRAPASSSTRAAASSCPTRPAGARRGGRLRHRRRRRAGRPEPDPRAPRRQVLRLHLRGPDDEGPQVRDRRGLRLDRALEAVHDRDDGAVPGPPLPHELDPRLREDDRASTRTRSARRPRGRPTRRSRWACSPARRRSRASARRCTTATRTWAGR